MKKKNDLIKNKNSFSNLSSFGKMEMAVTVLIVITFVVHIYRRT